MNKEFWVDLWAGWAGGVASLAMTQPVDTVLTRMQALRLAPGVDGSARAVCHTVGWCKLDPSLKARFQSSICENDDSAFNLNLGLKLSLRHYNTVLAEGGAMALWRGATPMVGGCASLNLA